MKSVAFKLWLGMMALVTVALILLWLFQIVFLNNFYTQMRIGDIKDAGSQLIGQMTSIQEFQEDLDSFAYNNNLTAEVLDMQSQTIYITGGTDMNGQMGMMKNNAIAEAYAKVQLGETVSIVMTHPRFGSQFMLIGLPFFSEGALQGALMLTVPLAPVTDTVEILKQQLIYITLILLVVTLLLSYMLSRSFTKPILDITKVSMDMAAGNLTARVKTGRRDEIGRLGEAVNYMGKELSKVEQLRKDLLANVSHELRTPLSLIKGYGETIRDVSGDNPLNREKQINIVIEEADRLGSIVEDLLKLSQMEAGYSDITIEKFMLNQTLNRVVKRYDLLSAKVKVEILQSITENVLTLGDESKIEQVLYNLINNAFNHSPIGGTINVSATAVKDRVRIEIKDMGEGIPAEEIPYIWDRFYKVDKSGKREKAGTGLGLAIVKNILNAHQASFGVESKAGGGTTFWFELMKAE